ncbi:MAG: universal stress protein [Actinomycetota bacterium]|nr:universal stress protein [Actinomycetota bacterium]
MNTLIKRWVLAGIDGADPGGHAVDWAAREARRRRLPLRIVHVLEWRPVETGEAGKTYVEMAWTRANGLTGEASRRVREIAPDIEVRAETVLGEPAGRLLELARDAELVVLGHRGRGGFAGLRLGSVSERVAEHAPCPVVVLRASLDREGPIIAGVDASPSADDVLSSAFEAASGQGGGLVVIHSVGDAAREPADLEHRIARWQVKHPQVPVEIRMTSHPAREALTEASSSGRLVVIGSRGHGLLHAALLGSTGLYLLRHAACPVLVARPVSPR